MTSLDRERLTSDGMRPGHELLADGRRLAVDWRVGRNRFLDDAEIASEAEYKRRAVTERRIMQHAHIGFRSVERTSQAMACVYTTCAKQGVTIDRFGITLDWSMGYPGAWRKGSRHGTGIILVEPEDFAKITNASPAAAHFGDFMLGLPGAVENTKHALAAGATSIGNLGQYFTFRLPDWDDDVATTEATVTAIALIAAQEAEVLVHSNLDDGFAGLFSDVSSALGMALVEKYIVEDLIGARLSHCYGHHFTAPLLRMAFHRALSHVSDAIGTMIFGNTVSYRSTPSGNFASLANYLQADIWALTRKPTGHAINPVPVTENERIPDVEEIIDAQIFAARLVEHATSSYDMVDFTAVDALADRLVSGASRFRMNLLGQLTAAGIDTGDPAQLLLALRRLGPRAIESIAAAGEPDQKAWGGRRAILVAEQVAELERAAGHWVGQVMTAEAEDLKHSGLRICVGCSDVHEHGKALIEHILMRLGITCIDGGVSVDADDLVTLARAQKADAIAISTYNGIALRFAEELRGAVDRSGSDLPIFIGGRLNQVPADSNSGLPVDVTADIAALGIMPCATPGELIGELAAMAKGKPRESDR